MAESMGTGAGAGPFAGARAVLPADEVVSTLRAPARVTTSADAANASGLCQ